MRIYDIVVYMMEAVGMSNSSCTVILPAYKEAENIGKMVACLRELYPDFKILIMDDNSKDGSREIVDALKDPMVRFVERDPSDRGLSASIFQGIAETDTDCFVNMDCDFQHPPETVGLIYECLKSGADFCIGVRKERRALSPVRWLASWGAHFLAALTLWLRNRPISNDIMSGFFGGNTDICRKIIEENRNGLDSKGFKALFDLLKYCPENTDIQEIEFEFGKRAAGESKLSSVTIVSVLKQCEPFGKILAGIAGRVV